MIGSSSSSSYYYYCCCCRCCWWSFTRVWVLSKPPQVFRTLLSILAVLNNAVVLMASTRPPTSKSSSPFHNPLVSVPKAPITIGIIVTFIIFFLASFSHQHLLMFFLWNLSDRESPQISRTLLSILAVFNNVVVWMVFLSVCYGIFKCSSQKNEGEK